MKGENGKGHLNFIKVPFKQALGLISKWSCFVHAGNLYINKNAHLQTLISEEFRAKLEKMLHFTQKHLGSIAKDQWLWELLKNISLKDLIDFEYTAKAVPSQGRLNLKNIDFKARKHYPPCMLSLHSALWTQHHLKHYGRL